MTEKRQPNMKRARMITLVGSAFIAYFTYNSSIQEIQSSNTDHLNKEKKYSNNIVDCNGTPQERRELVLSGNSVTKDQWLKVIKCTNKRENKLVGYYALHVSKSGGTSLCNLFKDEHCFVPPQNNQKANCWSPEYKKMGVRLGPQWQRMNHSEQFILPTWTRYDEKTTYSSSCEEIANFLEESGQAVAMSENWLPKGGNLCQNHFINIFIMRDPLRRIISHFQHLFHLCVKTHAQKKENETLCLTMLNDKLWNRGNETYFNLTVMMESFDIVTDNYYLRSLNDQKIYGSPFGMNGRGEEYLNKALQNLQNFDWILILDDESNNSLENNININSIVRNGLGLLSEFGVSNQRSRGNLDISSINLIQRDFEVMEHLNRYDLQIWHEARRLNRMDIEYINEIRKFNLTTRASFNGFRNCCGHICQHTN